MRRLAGDYQGDKDSDIYVVTRPAGEIEDVDTTIRFLPDVLEAQYPGYATDPASKEALADALVASEVAVMGGISKVDWLAEEFVDDGSTDDFEDDQRRRLESYESVLASVQIKSRGASPPVAEPWPPRYRRDAYSYRVTG